MFPRIAKEEGTSGARKSSQDGSETLSTIHEQVPQTVVDRVKDSANVDSASLSSLKSDRSEKQPDTTSISSGDRFFSLPASHSETSSVNDGAIDQTTQVTNDVHVLEEEDKNNPFLQENEEGAAASSAANCDEADKNIPGEPKRVKIDSNGVDLSR